MNSLHWIDWVIVLSFFIALLTIGNLASKKVLTNMDYMLAGKSAGRISAAISTAATDFGGVGLIGGVGLVYSVGISGVFWNLAAAPAWIVLGIIIAAPLRKLALTTVPEYLEKRYDSKTRFIATILHLVGIILSITAQTIVAGLAITALTGISKEITVIIATIVFVIYTAAGGLVAVIWTDIFKYVILMLGVLIAAIFSLNAGGGWNQITLSLPDSYWDIGALGWMEPLAWVALGFYTYGTNQAFIQRIFACEDEKIARFSYIYTGINYVIYAAIITMIGLGAAVVVPGLSDPEMAFPVIVRDVLPIGVRGLLIATILSATMSTSSSVLNAATTIFCIDIYKRIINRNAKEKRLLKVARLSTVVIACISLMTTYILQGIIDIIILASLIYSVGVFFPIIIGIFNKRVNAEGAFSAIVLGGLSAVISNYLLYDKAGGILSELHPMFTGSIVSLSTLIIVSHIKLKSMEKK